MKGEGIIMGVPRIDTVRGEGERYVSPGAGGGLVSPPIGRRGSHGSLFHRSRARHLVDNYITVNRLTCLLGLTAKLIGALCMDAMVEDIFPFRLVGVKFTKSSTLYQSRKKI